MSAARPPEGGSHRSRQAEGRLMSAARPPEGGSHRSRQAEGRLMSPRARRVTHPRERARC